MKRSFAALAVVAALSGWALISPAHAAPPTVVPSPGYDARLQEQRSATTVYTPAPRTRKSRRPVKRTY